MKSFKDAVHAIVKKIPKGKTMTYKEVATKAGKPNAARAVGGYMSKNADKTIPCHRVVRSDGKIGDYNGLQGKKTGSDAKIALLRKEGVKI
ncbi:MAG: MGMT family protein [Candidatus Pacebacteria bacterium]|nr:MGMT family protein [Candidatus Paceibacterota bacterium]MBP9851752.1 MGMT family protein [Candidatus Paceibacterota bacterium]